MQQGDNRIPVRLVVESPAQGGGGDCRIPARVHVAMEFLQRLNWKSGSKIVVGDVGGAECFEGDPLTEDEQSAQATACHLLDKYFTGKLEPDPQEAIELKSLLNAVEQKRVWLIHCVAKCGGSDPRCSMCGGTGLNEVRPASR